MCIMGLLRTLYSTRHISSTLLKILKNGVSDSQRNYEKSLEGLKSNPFFNKYAKKIAALQEESPDELRQRLEENEKRKEKKSAKICSEERSFSVPIQPCKPQLDVSQVSTKKKLEDIMKTELLKDKSDEEIKNIWINYHRDKDVVVSVIPKHIYSIMYETGKEFSTFLLPVPRKHGYEFIMCQFTGHEIHFTPLLAYQTHKENAPECLMVIFYTDIQEEKGIVLMKGDYDANILNSQEAQCLINELQLYYAQNNETKLNLLRKFTYKPSEFNHMDLIAEIECLS